MTDNTPSESFRESSAALAEAMGDPLRVQVAYALMTAPGLTVRQIADRTGEAPRTIRYQLAVLREAGLVEISDQGTRRGAIEHHYSLTRPLLITDDEEDSLPASLRMGVALGIFNIVAADVTAATAGGTFGVRSGDHHSQLFGTVDEAGWEELARMSASYLEEAQHVLQEAGERLRKSGEAAIPITTAHFLFEGPDRPEAVIPG
jgi:DNA-binding transcriptional ArsR family regulator